MAQNFNKTQQLGGLNSDDEVRALPDGDYLDAKNIRNAVNAANRGGTLTNVLGNLPITKVTCPYNGGAFPSGRNKCIGAVEDTNNTGALFFVWNSQGKHGIYHYFRNVTDPANPFGVVEQVIQYDFGWTKGLRITSINLVYGDPTSKEYVGDLAYWCDKKPRKINFTKGNVVGKLKSWNLYLPQTVTVPAITNFTFKDFAGNIVYQAGIVIPDNTNRSAIITSIAEVINASSDYPVTAVACDCSLQLFEKVSGTVWTVETDADQILISPDNWYGDILIERFFDRCKYPPLQAPKPIFKQDTDYEPNFVQKKVFQFRLEYIYDDREQSALGVWSQIPINNLGCDGTSNIAYNYIDVNFNDPNLVDPTILVLLKKVRFIAREQNTGKDRSVIDLEPCDYLDFVNNEFVARYDFYNDIISSAIDDATAAKIFDDVPLETEAEQMKDNRMIEFNCLTGYNPPACIDAKYQMDFVDLPNPEFYKVTFRVRVLTFSLNDGLTSNTGNFNSLFPNYYKYPFWEPPSGEKYNLLRGGIFHDTSRTENNYPFFGGGGFGIGPGGDFGIRGGMETEYDQRCPEGGFPIYFAGTPYFSVSRQISTGLPNDSVGALDTSSQQLRDNIGNYLYCGGGGLCSDLYSEVTILVPKGEYIARAASHWCSFGDKLGKGYMYNLSSGTQYQKTSTNVCACVDANGNWATEKEIKVQVNGDMFGGTFVIMDISPPYDVLVYPTAAAAAWYPINGYLFNDATNILNPNDQLFLGQSVEKALINYDSPESNNPVNGWGSFSTTDHNGYFFGIGRGVNPDPDSGDPTRPIKNIKAYQVGNSLITDIDTMYLGSLTDLYNKSLTPYTFDGSNAYGPVGLQLTTCIVTTTLAEARDKCSTFLDGKVIDLAGNGINGAIVLYENGRYAQSNQDGTYDILAWGDVVTPNLPKFTNNSIPAVVTDDNNRIVDILIFSLPIICVPAYPNGQEDASILVDPFGINTTTTGPPYSPTAPYLVNPFTIDERNDPSKKAHKRGGNYTYGVRLYDAAGRCCTVVSAFEMYVPFITEDIGKYSIENFSNVAYPANTFKYGKPSIKWVLANNTAFPPWVKTIQWMRTKNSIYEPNYLQWVANQVTYLSSVAQPEVPEIQTSFQNGDAVAIRISLKNIIDYASQNPTSTISYTYAAGDRLRLMYDRTLNPINGLNDFEVTSYDTTTQNVLIKTEGFNQEILSGSVFEIFNPKSVETQDEQIFYEVGEVINVNNGIPEKFSGVFTNGDTYWRGRLITVNDEATKFASAYPIVIEDSSVSDFYVSESQDIGRIGIIDDNFRQIRRPMLLKASNAYIPSTAINGLSAFEALNETELDRANGQGKRLVSINQTVVAISTVRETSTYIQVVTFQQANQGDGIIAVANQYFGTQYPHAKTLGTDLPASVFVNDGIIFGYHSGRSDVWMYQGDGEQAISDVKMKNFFQQLGNDGVSDAVAVYDRFHEEYILTLWRDYHLETRILSITPLAEQGNLITVLYPDGIPLPELNALTTVQYLARGTWYDIDGEVTQIDAVQEGSVVTILVGSTANVEIQMQVNIVYSLPETIVWYNGSDATPANMRYRWKAKSDLTPEAYVQCGSDVISFKNGMPWISDKNPLRNNFFGTQYVSMVKPVFNGAPDLLKVWNACILKTLQSDNQNNWAATEVVNDNGQRSRIKQGNFTKKGEDWFSVFFKDLNDVTVAPNLRISQGRSLRSSTLTCQLENDSTGEVRLWGWVANFTLSELTQPKR